MGEDEWYEKGIKDLSIVLKRNIKSIREAIKKLKEKNMITTQKNQNTFWIKQTLSEDELYSRMAFIMHMDNPSQSLQELEEDLKKEIKRLDEEIAEKKEIIAQQQEEDRIRELVVNQISDNDIEKFVDRIIASRTYVNVNKSLEEFIKDEIAFFREEMFSKYGESKGEEDLTQYS
ncbi:MAG: hypothetical protein ACTSXA_14715 [Candidatus Heimdallarchaeota archaeon]